MKILIACEYSGIVRDAFIAKGHEVMSCDILQTDNSGPHYCGDVMNIINDGWDMMVAHPPCTYLSVSGLHWNKKQPGRAKKTELALDFVRILMGADIDKICIENPVSCISSKIRKPDCIIQPYHHGHDASKKTCLWLKNLPVITPTSFIDPRIVDGKARWSNQTDAGQNNLPTSKDRWKLRSTTYHGIANAMADQWG